MAFKIFHFGTVSAKTGGGGGGNCPPDGPQFQRPCSAIECNDTLMPKGAGKCYSCEMQERSILLTYTYFSYLHNPI